MFAPLIGIDVEKAYYFYPKTPSMAFRGVGIKNIIFYSSQNQSITFLTGRSLIGTYPQRIPAMDTLFQGPLEA